MLMKTFDRSHPCGNLKAWMSPRGGCVQWTDMDSGAAAGGDCGRGTELSSPGV